MSPKHIVAAWALMASASSFAFTVNGGFVSSPDPAAETLAGLHVLDGALFIDTYDFTVTGSGIALVAFLDGAFDLSGGFGAVPFKFDALVLADASNNALAGIGAIDIDPTDGWSVFAALPGAGNYRVLLQGTAPTTAADPTETQFYIGVLSTQVNAVPEPSTYGLAALALLALAGTRRRQ